MFKDIPKIIVENARKIVGTRNRTNINFIWICYRYMRKVIELSVYSSSKKTWNENTTSLLTLHIVSPSKHYVYDL